MCSCASFADRLCAVGEVIVLVLGMILIKIYGEDCSAGDCIWWRCMMVAGVVPDIIAVLLVYFYLPESPRFLAVQV